MANTYKSIMLTKKGTPDVLKLMEQPLRNPDPTEVRIRIICTGVGFTDVIMRYGYYPYAPKKLPFAPGYEIIGTIDALGSEVTGWKVGDRVAALTVHGGYAEYIYLSPDDLVAVPDGLDPAEALCLILNYTTAYQMLHRTAKIQKGNTIFLTGASGGVGNAMLELGKLENLKMYGTASKSKFDLVESLGGIPIDYKSQNFVKVVKEKTGGKGVDAAFDGIGTSYLMKTYSLVKKDGVFVSFGITGSIKNGKSALLPLINSFTSLGLTRILPGKKSIFYGITAIYRKDKQPFKADLPKLFTLLKEGKLHPVIATKMPFTEARQANEMLEKGQVNGKIILLCQ
jgi:NADPH:quinone reductase